MFVYTTEVNLCYDLDRIKFWLSYPLAVSVIPLAFQATPNRDNISDDVMAKSSLSSNWMLSLCISSINKLSTFWLYH